MEIMPLMQVVWRERTVSDARRAARGRVTYTADAERGGGLSGDEGSAEGDNGERVLHVC